MIKLKLNAIVHREEQKLALYFEKNNALIAILRTNFPQLRWSKTQKAWLLPYDSKLKCELFRLLKGKVWIDYSDLNRIENGKFRIENVELSSEKSEENGKLRFKSEAQSLGVKVKSKNNILPDLSQERKLTIQKFKNYLTAKRYSANTIETYSDAVSIFLRFSAEKEIENLTNRDVEYFNNEYILKHGLSASYQNQVVNALKLFFKVVEGKTIVPELIERPRREHRLPNVLSKEEVKAILNAHKNLKHKMMLTLIYSCGLRRSELLHLKPLDIDSKRNIVIIKQSKGKKDRIVPLSPKVLEMLREYYKLYQPKTWLFEGQESNTTYSEKSLQNVLKQSLIKCKIKKPVTLHWLRHSYATHLLESGTDLRYIQELLGHNSSRTTEIYTHVSTKNIQNIISPFDSL
jgi:integrase/recombinase XerD